MTSQAGIPGDKGVREARSASVRTCIVTREERAPDELIRFVLSPEGAITPDLARKLPGRGVWVTCSAAVLGQAVTRNAFAKALKKQVKAPPDLVGQVERLLLARCIQALALVNKAGLMVAGFAKVDAELDKGKVAVLVHATDAAEDGCGKLDRKWLAIAAATGCKAPIVRELTRAEMDLATGRENVVHAGLNSGGVTARFSVEIERLGRYRSHNSSPARGFAAE